MLKLHRSGLWVCQLVFFINQNREEIFVSPGFAGGAVLEGPHIDSTGAIISWKTFYRPEREIPIDMAGFAVSLISIIEKNVTFRGDDCKMKNIGSKRNTVTIKLSFQLLEYESHYNHFTGSRNVFP